MAIAPRLLSARILVPFHRPRQYDCPSRRQLRSENRVKAVTDCTNRSSAPARVGLLILANDTRNDFRHGLARGHRELL